MSTILQNTGKLSRNDYNAATDTLQPDPPPIIEPQPPSDPTGSISLGTNRYFIPAAGFYNLPTRFDNKVILFLDRFGFYQIPLSGKSRTPIITTAPDIAPLSGCAFKTHSQIIYAGKNGIYEPVAEAQPRPKPPIIKSQKLLDHPSPELIPLDMSIMDYTIDDTTHKSLFVLYTTGEKVSQSAPNMFLYVSDLTQDIVTWNRSGRFTSPPALNAKADFSLNGVPPYETVLNNQIAPIFYGHTRCFCTIRSPHTTNFKIADIPRYRYSTSLECSSLYHFFPSDTGRLLLRVDSPAETGYADGKNTYDPYTQSSLTLTESKWNSDSLQDSTFLAPYVPLETLTSPLLPTDIIYITSLGGPESFLPYFADFTFPTHTQPIISHYLDFLAVDVRNNIWLITQYAFKLGTHLLPQLTITHLGNLNFKTNGIAVK